MELSSLLNVTPLYIAVLGLLFIYFTLSVGLYRVRSKVLLGIGDDPELLRRVRGQGNFIETVPMALFLLVTMEFLGASEIWLHALGTGLVVGRITHYIGITGIAPTAFRVFGISTTIAVVLVSSLWVLIHYLSINIISP